MFRGLGCEVWGSDISEGMLRQAGENLSEHGMEIPLLQADFTFKTDEPNRTVVFDVGGVITLASKLVAAGDNLTIAGQIKKSLEDLLDRKVHHSTVYRMLHRNGWREIVTRPVHPQAKEEAQEAFRKTSRSS